MEVLFKFYDAKLALVSKEVTTNCGVASFYAASFLVLLQYVRTT